MPKEQDRSSKPAVSQRADIPRHQKIQSRQQPSSAENQYEKADWNSTTSTSKQIPQGTSKVVATPTLQSSKAPTNSINRIRPRTGSQYGGSQSGQASDKPGIKTYQDRVSHLKQQKADDSLELSRIPKRPSPGKNPCKEEQNPNLPSQVHYGTQKGPKQTLNPKTYIASIPAPQTLAELRQQKKE